MIPLIETARLRLRPRSPADLEAYLAMDQDPAVAKYIWGDPPGPDERRAELEERLRNDGKVPGGSWTVEDKATSDFLGWCGLMELEKSGLIEIGYRYLPKAWGRGLATEAAARVLDYGFRDFGFDPIVAVVHPENRGSQRVLEKIGLVCVGEAFHYGQDLPFFRLSREVYLAARERDV